MLSPYNIQPPLIQIEPGEIRNWTLIGSAINFKKTILLTSLSKHDTGGVCLRIPTTFVDWDFETEYSFDNQNSEQVFTIFFSEDLCPVNAFIWKGISITINTTKSPNGIVLLSENNGKRFKHETTKTILEFPNSNGHITNTIKLTKNQTHFDLIFITQNSEFSYSFMNPLNFSFGYFSIKSQINGTIQNNSLNYVHITPKSPINRTINIDVINKKNRKSLSINPRKHKITKTLRKEYMKTLYRYQDEINYNNGILTDTPKKFKDSFREINELIYRAGEGLNLEELESFIIGIVQERILISLDKIELIGKNLKDLRNELIDSWGNIISELRGIVSSVDKDMLMMKNKIKNDAMNVINELAKRNSEFKVNTRRFYDCLHIFVVIILAIAIAIYALKSLPIKLIAQALNADVNIVNQTGLLSFESIELKNKDLEFSAKNMNVSLGLFAITSKKITISFDELNLQLNTYNIGSGNKNRKTKVNDPLNGIKMKTLSSIIFFYFKKLFLKIKSFKLCLPNSVSVETSINFEYKRSNVSQLDLSLGSIKYLIQDKEVTTTPFVFSINSDLFPIYSLISQTNPFLITSNSIKDARISTSGTNITLSPLNVDICMYPGNINLTFSELTVTQWISLPTFCLSFKSFYVDTTIPIRPIPINPTHFVFEITEFNIGFITEHFLRIPNLKGTISDLKKMNPIVNIDKIHFYYTSFDGLEIFQLYAKLRNPIYQPLRLVLDFPDFQFNINKFSGTLLLTDNAKVQAKSSNVKYSNKCITFPEVYGYINTFQCLKIKSLIISSPDKEYLTFNATKISVIEQQKFNVPDFIYGVIYGWRIIKPWASSHTFDSETLPLPFHIIVDKISLKMTDTFLNQRLFVLGNTIQEYLKEKSILEYIYQSKISQLQFTPQQKQYADDKFQELLFENYQNLFKKQTFHKYRLLIEAQGLDIKLDSRNVVNKVQMLHEFDPNTAELYPNVEWETLEGLKINVNIKDAAINCYNLKEPIIKGSELNLNGILLVGEISDGKFLDIPITVLGKEFITKGTVTDIKLYCDLNINLGDFGIYIGGNMMKIFDDFVDSITSLIPKPYDPSPSLKWWDELRYVFHGRYHFQVDNIKFNFVGGKRYDDFKNVAILSLTNFKANIINGVYHITSNEFNLFRCNNGPQLLHFSDFDLEVKFIIKTPLNNQKLHNFIADINQFNDPNYDTYKNFRATAITTDFILKYSNGEVSPFAMLDVAHFLWLIDPILNLFDSPLVNEVYTKKFGQLYRRKQELYFLSDLKLIFIFHINNASSFSFRIFDCFPIETKNIYGTSIDLTLVNFSLNLIITKNPKSNVEFKVSLKSPQILLNTTDLSYYSKNYEDASPTFAKIINPEINYGKDLVIKIDTLQIYGTQLFVRYIEEFIEAIIHFLPDMNKTNKNNNKNKETNHNENITSKSNNKEELLLHLLSRTPSQKVVTTSKAIHNHNILQEKNNIDSILEKFQEIFLDLTINSIQILFESLLYDIKLLCVIQPIKFNIKFHQTLDLIAANLDVETITISTENNFIQNINEIKSSIGMIEGIRVIFYQNELNNNKNLIAESFIKNISLNCNPKDIACIKQYIQEISHALMTIKSEKNITTNSNNNPNNNQEVSLLNITFNTYISKCQLFLFDNLKNPICFLVSTDLTFQQEKKIDGSSNSMLLVDDLKINDARVSAKTNLIFSRWLDRVDPKVKTPLLRIQAKSKPPIGGIKFYNHFEINLDPTIVIYESTFFGILIKSILNNDIGMPSKPTMKFGFERPDIRLPRILLNDGVLPIITIDHSSFLEGNKSKELKVMINRADSNFLLRYFKITPVTLNLSYHNPENNVIPDINEFHGLFNGIIYQDLTANIETLISKLIIDISRDIIPQFLKHLVGLGKLPSSKENELNLWLSDNQDKAASRRKELLFGKSRK